MSSLNRCLGSWLVVAKVTRNPRDCRLAALAGLLPDADGVGMIVDIAKALIGNGPRFITGLTITMWNGQWRLDGWQNQLVSAAAQSRRTR